VSYYVDPATKVYKADIRVRGVPRLRVSLRTKRKDEAATRYAAVLGLVRAKHTALLDDLRGGRLTVEQVAKAARNREAPETLAPQAPWPTVDDAVALYVAWLGANPNKQAKTKANARTHLVRFAAFMHEGQRMGDVRLDRVTVAMTTAYQRHELDAGTPPNSLTSYMGRVRALFRWHIRQEATQAREQGRQARALHVPLDTDVLFRGTTRRDVWLTEGEAARILARTPEALTALVTLGLLAGLRVGEALALRPGFDVDLANGLLIIQPHPDGWRPKTGKRREVPIAADLRPVLERHLATYASAERLFPATLDPTRARLAKFVSDDLKTIVEGAGLPYGQKTPRGVTFHTFRHTFASWLVMRGVDLYTVAQLLGNRLAEVEQTYAHLSPDHRRRAVEKLAGALNLGAAA
jgi:integrase